MGIDESYAEDPAWARYRGDAPPVSSEGVSAVTSSFDPGARGLPPGFESIPPPVQPRELVPVQMPSQAATPVQTQSQDPSQVSAQTQDAFAPQGALPPEEPEDPQEQLKDVIRMPQFWAQAFGTMAAPSHQVKSIMRRAYPDMQIEEKNGFITFQMPGAEKYALKPGARASDLARLATTIGATAAIASGAGAAATAAGATSLGGALGIPTLLRGASALATSYPRLALMAAGAGDTALIEGGKSLVGEPFGTDSVVAGGLLAPVVPALINAVKGVGRGIVNYFVSPALAGEVAATGGEYGAAVIQAAKGGRAGEQGILNAAASTRPNQAVMDAANQLDPSGGLMNAMPLGALADSKAARQIEATLGSAGTKLGDGLDAGVEKVGGVVRDVTKAGTPTLSDLSSVLSAAEQSEIAALKKRADEIYEAIKTKIPAKTPAEAPEALAFIKRVENDMVVKGSRTPGEQYVDSPLMKYAKHMLTPTPRLGKNGKHIKNRLGQLMYDPPTYNRIDALMRDLGDAARKKGAFGDDPNRWIAAELADLVDQARTRVAQSRGAGELLEEGRASVSRRYAVQDRAMEAFNERLTGTLVPEGIGAIEALSRHGDYGPLADLLNKVDPAQRKLVAQSSLATFVQDKPIEEFTRLWGALDRNAVAKNKLLKELPAGAGGPLDSLYKVTEAMTRAMDAKKLAASALEEVNPGTEFLSTMLGAAQIGTLALPWRIAGMSRMVLTALKNPKDPGVVAARQWFESPEARQVLLGLASRRPLAPGVVERMVNSGPFKRFATFVPEVVDKLPWVKRIAQGVLRHRTGKQLAGHAAQAITNMDDGSN